uniref:hypothetical protein n=1 Tax=Salmonella sp. SAL04281 TaxID=3159859 RepID=UPI003979650C
MSGLFMEEPYRGEHPIEILPMHVLRGENCHQVKAGMSQREVEDLLGVTPDNHSPRFTRGLSTKEYLTTEG